MEKQTQNNNGRKPPAAKLPKDRVFGANAVHMSEDDADKLIGGIVEKGISDNYNPTPPSSAPRPSVLPFPVARHRSHGPHWTPKVSQFVGSGGHEDDEVDEEDNDPTNYDPIADFAKPIEKKEKKGLDLSKWRQLVPTNDSNIHEKHGNHNVKRAVEEQRMNGKAKRSTHGKSTEIKSAEPFRSFATELDRSKELSSAKSNVSEAFRLGHDQPGNIKGNTAELISSSERNKFVNEAQLERSPHEDVDVQMKEFPSNDMIGVREKKPSVTFGPSSPGYEQGNMSLDSQIDAENRSLLERMSPEEIAEAQAEIRNRMNPELLRVLKQRGQRKLENQKNSSSGSHAGDLHALGNIQADKHLSDYENESTALGSKISPPAKIPSIHNMQKRPHEGGVENMILKGDRLWGTWSKRVEATRDLRFSLDGNVIEGSSLGQAYSADNVAERDLLRTEGDPSAAGYTIKEALALARSVVPGQRALALHLIASVLSKAIHNICKNQLDVTTSVSDENSPVDWEAVWAYALGPEPELVLSLRMALDDNHNSVVLASARVIQYILAYDVNENFFNKLEKMGAKALYTAPVFRSRPDIKHGFLGGGFWKYSAKPSNILLSDEVMNEGEHTIQDDNVVAGQDVAAGLVRMGILPRLLYLLELNPAVALEECILSILVAIARHSPTCANAIWNCERLVQTIVDRFTVKDTLELQTSKIRSVTVLRVLAQSSKITCLELIKKGFFQVMTWQLYRVTSSIDEWVKSGKEYCKLASELMVEQLRFWKVCIMYGHCISCFTGFFPALCLWLNPPTFEKLTELNLFHEFASISKEVYLVLETLARRLPDTYLPQDKNHHLPTSYGDNVETWCWNDVGPMVDMALKWIDLKNDSTLSRFICQQNGVKCKSVDHNTSLSSLLWVIAAVMQMLHTVLKKATPGDMFKLKGVVNKIALQIIKSGVLLFSDQSDCLLSAKQCGMGSFIENLCHIRRLSDFEASLASVWCLHGLFRVLCSIDHLIQLAGNKAEDTCSQEHELPRESKILNDGILKCSLAEWRTVVSEFTKLTSSEWHFAHSIEVFGRGGPAPGVGAGWGFPGGGFWSLTGALVRADVRMLIQLLGTFHSFPAIDLPGVEEKTFITQSINSALAASLVSGPGDKETIENVLNILLQIPVLKYLNQCISQSFLCHSGSELLKWEYKEDELEQFSKILSSHFRNRWLSLKKKKKKKKPEAKDNNVPGCKTVKKGGNSLDTIHEDVETSPSISEDINSLTVEWAHQRLPLPSYWLLSPIATISDFTSSDMPNNSGAVPLVHDPVKFVEVAQAGLFFLLGIEALSSKLSYEDNSPLRSIPLIWKLHSLSVVLLVGMGVLEEERSRDVYGALQTLYGQHLDKLQIDSSETVAQNAKILKFQSEIHENYSAFVETLVDQFAAISYGDLIYGRQVAIYLHRHVEAPVRLAAWNALSNARVLELLPSLDNCLSQAEGYLEPSEEDDAILEAYVKSWISGSLDRAATRGSVTYTIAVHHLSSFIFSNHCGERLLLRNKLVKSLLRDYSRKQQQHEAMMSDFVQCNYHYAIRMPEQNPTTSSQFNDIDQRFELLTEACEGNSQLLTVVEKLKSSVSKKPRS